MKKTQYSAKHNPKSLVQFIVQSLVVICSVQQPDGCCEEADLEPRRYSAFQQILMANKTGTAQGGSMIQIHPFHGYQVSMRIFFFKIKSIINRLDFHQDQVIITITISDESTQPFIMAYPPLPPNPTLLSSPHNRTT